MCYGNAAGSILLYSVHLCRTNWKLTV